MPEEFDLSELDPGSLKRGRFTYLPVVPGRMEFAVEVRRAILETSMQTPGGEVCGLDTAGASERHIEPRLPGLDRLDDQPAGEALHGHLGGAIAEPGDEDSASGPVGDAVRLG